MTRGSRKKSAKKSAKEPPKKTPPKKIGDVITDLMAQRGYAQIASTAELRKWWTDALSGDSGPSKLGKFSLPRELKRGVLHVMVSNSVVMQELAFRKQELIQALNQAKPEQQIKDIRYRLGSIR